jgi:hypothetical protein
MRGTLLFISTREAIILPTDIFSLLLIPDLANQVEGTDSYPNRLALLRGFFFWLEVTK